MMGGLGAHEYMAPCPAGENEVALAAGYAANVEVARADASRSRCPRDEPSARAGRDARGCAPSTRWPAQLSLPRGALLKAFPVVAGAPPRRATGARAPARRPSRQRDQARQRARRAVAPGDEEEIQAHIGPPGSLGPVGLTGGAECCSTRRSAPAAPTSSAPTAPTPTCAACARAATSPSARPTCARRGWRHGRRAPDHDRARDRDRQRLQARHALLRAAGRDLPG